VAHHLAPILISFSFKLVSDQSLIGSGVASVRRKLVPRLSQSLACGNEADFQGLSLDDHAVDVTFDQIAIRNGGRVLRGSTPVGSLQPERPSGFFCVLKSGLFPLDWPSAAPSRIGAAATVQL
jgi:hypothetical protein